MKHYHQVKSLVTSGLLLITLSLFSYHSFCNDTYHLSNAIQRIPYFLQCKNIRIGRVEIDVTSRNNMMTDAERITRHADYQFDMGSFEALNRLFFLFSAPPEGTARRLNQQNTGEVWNREDAVTFLQLITDIFLTNMQEFNDLDNDGRSRFISQMSHNSNTLKISPNCKGQSRGMGPITMEDYLNPQSEIANDGYSSTNNGTWLLALAFFLPFRSYEMAEAQSNSIHSQVHQHFDYIASTFIDKRFRRYYFKGTKRSKKHNQIKPLDVITSPFNTLLQEVGFEREFLYLSFMRSLSLAMTQILIAPTEESLSQASTVSAVLSNHISSDLHIATIRAILNTQHPHLLETGNQDLFIQILQANGVENADQVVADLLNSRTPEHMRAVINGVLNNNLVTAPERERLALTPQQQHSGRAGQIDDFSGGSLCSNENCPHHQRLLSMRQQYVVEEIKWEEDRGVLRRQLLSERTENSHLRAELDKVKTECELKLRTMREELDRTSQNAQSANEQLQKLRDENSRCNQIIHQLTNQNEQSISSETGTESNTDDVIASIFEQTSAFHQTAAENKQRDQQIINTLQTERNALNQRVEAIEEQHRSNQTTIQQLRDQIGNLQELNDELIQQSERQAARPHGLITETLGYIAPQQNQAAPPSQPAVSHRNEARAAQQTSAPICSICLGVNEAHVAMLPCGHAQFCPDCADDIIKKGNDNDGGEPLCPICRALIKGSIKVHLK